MSASRSSGNGGWASGLTAIRTSNNGLSSPAVRFDESVPQPLQRWIRTHSPSLRTVIAIGSIEARQSDARSPGSMSRWRDQRQFGQWLRWAVPGASVGTSRRQWTHLNDDGCFTWAWSPKRQGDAVGSRHAPVRTHKDRPRRTVRVAAAGIRPVTSGWSSGGVTRRPRRLDPVPRRFSFRVRRRPLAPLARTVDSIRPPARPFRGRVELAR